MTAEISSYPSGNQEVIKGLYYSNNKNDYNKPDDNSTASCTEEVTILSKSFVETLKDWILQAYDIKEDSDNKTININSIILLRGIEDNVNIPQ